MREIRLFMRNPLGVIGLIIILLWIMVAVFAPVLAPPDNERDPYRVKRIGYSSVPQPPQEKAPFGITEGGYDIYYGIIWGSRTAFRIGVTVVFFSALIGVIIGGLGAYFGGLVDNIVMRIVDLLMSFPFLIAVIIMTVIFGKGLKIIILSMILFGWRNYARIIRSEVLSVKEREYIMAARAIGAPWYKIFFQHVLPNSIYSVFVVALLNIGRIVILASSLSFIGVGSEPGYADWGQMINFARDWLFGLHNSPLHYWYTYTFPSIALFSFVFGWTLFGDALRDILDPQLKGSH